ncbi:hypothetical protein BDU57DRAFT_532261 [Ampelomyces quisqualis]|uniref:CFEM domain-containing protein n=1 Tax=Ampelomyces quisqualis TaxID=50730 RepID=A0A6A5QEE0_AMPQU|nr:hypothetical protein BDU57DRAFT_532261 [Ampelomyces quisqualis]
MKASLSLVTVVFGVVGITVASPVEPRAPTMKRADVGVNVAGVGQCPTDCWNEAAANAGCDPNADDSCLCGPFFDNVASCTSSLCNAGENLAALDFMRGACTP